MFSRFRAWLRRLFHRDSKGSEIDWMDGAD
jgi:hypothetical protein